MASEFDTVVVEIRGMERLEAAIEKFVQALNGFGHMAEKAAPEIDAVIQAMDGIGLEELNDPAGAEQFWPDAATRAADLFPGVPLVVDPTMTEADGVRLVKVRLPFQTEVSEIPVKSTKPRPPG